MSPLKTSIMAALAAAALTAGTFYHFHRKNARQAGYLRDQNTRLRYQAYEKHRLGMAQPTTVAGNGDAVVTPASAATPVENYRDLGQTTPLDALQTLAWACDRGDTETLAKLIHFDQAARTKIDSYLSSLPQADAPRWKSAEDFATTQLAFVVMASPFPNADVLNVETIENLSASRAKFHLPGTRHDQTQFQKVGANWRVVITESLADLFIKTAAEVETANSAKR